MRSIPNRHTSAVSPARQEVDLPAQERQHLAMLLRRARFLLLRMLDTSSGAPAYRPVRRELAALVWALRALGGQWGCTMTDDMHTLLTTQADADPASGDDLS